MCSGAAGPLDGESGKKKGGKGAELSVARSRTLIEWFSEMSQLACPGDSSDTWLRRVLAANSTLLILILAVATALAFVAFVFDGAKWTGSAAGVALLTALIGYLRSRRSK